MKFFRIWALMIRYALIIKWTLGRQLLILYFPAIDIILWGFVAKGFSQAFPTTTTLTLYLASRVLLTASTAIYQEISGNLQVELEALNIINLFSTPMTICEWVIANIINGSLRGLIILVYGMILSLLIFGINLFAIGSILFILVPLMLLAWLPVAILICALYLNYGLAASFARWTLPQLLIFLSAVFYPLDLLPSWLKSISQLLPTTHLFLTLQKLILYNNIDNRSIIIGSMLIAIYTLLSTLYLAHSFAKSKKNGLALLEHV